MIRRLLNWLTILVFFFACTCTGLFVLFFYYGRGLPDYDYLHHYEPPTINRLYTSQGQVLREFSQERRIYMPIDRIPSFVVTSFLVAEDKNFYYHCGLDISGILRAILTNSAQGSWSSRPLGGSSITQQVAKNFLVGKERSFDRKAKEAIMALRLESTFTKRRILELYLNEIYLGMGAYGVAAAALTYFNKPLDKLSIPEIAFLAAMPKAPSFYPNQKDLLRGKARRNWVIDRLAEEGFLTENQANIYKTSPLVLNQRLEDKKEPDYASEHIRQDLIAQFGEKAMTQGGFAVKTTIESSLQKIADTALQEGLISYDRRHGWRGPFQTLPENVINTPKNWLAALRQMTPPPGLGRWTLAVVLEVTAQDVDIGLKNGETGTILLDSLTWARKNLPQQFLGPIISHPKQVLSVGDVIAVSQKEDKTYALEQIPEISGGLVALDPHTGRVLALSGGYSFDKNQFNCATQAKRQPGSAFKPFVYLAALEKGYKPTTRVLDAPVIVNVGGKMGVYAPKNITNRYYGPTPLQSGLIYSRNVMTVRLAQQVGLRRIAKIAKAFQVVDNLPMQLAMALGAAETTLLKLTAAYGMIANGGHLITPVMIDSIQDRHNKMIYTSPPSSKISVASPKAIKELLKMMEGVVQRGTARELQSLDRPIAGKTGSTNDFKDAWFVGFTPDLVVGVFVGFPAPKTMGEGEGGTRVAVPIFRKFMEEAMKDKPVLRFDAVEG